MSLIRWAPMMDPFEEFEELFRRFPRVSGEKAFMPAMDVYEEGKNLMVKTSLPGINPKDVEVSVENGVLTVQGKTNKEHEVDEKNYYRKEIRSGSFYRQVVLPTACKEDGVKADFEDGQLLITCPKKEKPEAKKIAVSVNTKKDTE